MSRFEIDPVMESEAVLYTSSSLLINYVLTLVTMNAAGSDYPAFIGHHSWHVTNQVALWAGHEERLQDAASEPEFIFKVIYFICNLRQTTESWVTRKESHDLLSGCKALWDITVSFHKGRPSVLSSTFRVRSSGAGIIGKMISGLVKLRKMTLRSQQLDRRGKTFSWWLKTFFVY